jgi:alginate O-acetyltransferase complex protein AlgJ
VIAQNDSGAFATRQALARELAAGVDRLAKKRAVIWEFASRELSVGDWKPIDWAHPGAAHASTGGPDAKR